MKQEEITMVMRLIGRTYEKFVPENADFDDPKVIHANHILINLCLEMEELVYGLKEDNPCDTCPCFSCSDCVECYGCKERGNKNPKCKGGINNV